MRKAPPKPPAPATVADLAPAPYNPRTITDEAARALEASMVAFGDISGIVFNFTTGNLVAGHQRRRVLQGMGAEAIEWAREEVAGVDGPERRGTIRTDRGVFGVRGVHWPLEKEMAANVAANSPTLTGTFDDNVLGEVLGQIEAGDADLFSALRFEELWEPAPPEPEQAESATPPNSGALAARFGIPPFSVLNAREGWWQERKRAWLALGIQSELGRGANLLAMEGARERQAGYSGGLILDAVSSSDAAFYAKKRKHEAETGTTLTRAEFLEVYVQPTDALASGTSIFDPVLCELAYRWFSPPNGVVLDPFAGGSVRGIVASHIGRRYFGVDLRAEQVEANAGQALAAKEPAPVWRCGDSQNIATICADVEADFIFSCPPYGDLEVYSDNEADISNMPYAEFVTAYRAIIAASCTLLRQDRFACFVVGDIRDKAGNYRNFVGDTVEAFRAAGLELYNEAILVTAVGSLSIRAGRQFGATRKLGKTHQNVLVFVKGDGKRATLALGECDFGECDDPAAGG